MIFSSHTLGCKVNQIEIEKIVSDLVDKGFVYTSNKNESDFLIINTCTVTQKSDQKSLKAIRQFSNLENLKYIFVTGCYSELEKDLRAKIDPKNIIISQKNKSAIPEIVEKTLAQHYGYHHHTSNYQDRWEAFKNSRIYIGSLMNNQDQFFDHQRAFVKIQDGCNHFCTYCRIPFARGAPVSRDAHDILNQVGKIDQNRIPEIVLSGINLGTYNDRKNQISFSRLLKLILMKLRHAHLRISSIEPYSLDDDFFSLLTHPRLVPHIHLALQGTSNRILKLMNRRYQLSQFKKIIDHFYSANDHFSITTDIIVGFRDETETEFSEGLEFIKQCGFSKIHVFPFSSRPLTQTDEIYRQNQSQYHQMVTPQIKRERSKTMRSLSQELHQKYLDKVFDLEQYFIIEGAIDLSQHISSLPNLPDFLLKDLLLFKGTSEYYIKGWLLATHETHTLSSKVKVKLVQKQPVVFLSTEIDSKITSYFKKQEGSQIGHQNFIGELFD